MTEHKTYKLKGYTVKVVPDSENPGVEEMHVERTWFVDPVSGDLVLRATTHIEGRRLTAEIRQGGHGREMPMPPPAIDRDAREQIKGAIEQELFYLSRDALAWFRLFVKGARQ